MSSPVTMMSMSSSGSCSLRRVRSLANVRCTGATGCGATATRVGSVARGLFMRSQLRRAQAVVASWCASSHGVPVSVILVYRDQWAGYVRGSSDCVRSGELHFLGDDLLGQGYRGVDGVRRPPKLRTQKTVRYWKRDHWKRDRG